MHGMASLVAIKMAYTIINSNKNCREIPFVYYNRPIVHKEFLSSFSDELSIQSIGVPLSMLMFTECV